MTGGMSTSTPFVVYDGRVVAVVGPKRFYFTVDDLDPAAAWFVSVMCLCKREVDEGRLTGPFTSELAERWARWLLVGPDELDGPGTDEEVAERLGVPVAQVTAARAELGSSG